MKFKIHPKEITYFNIMFSISLITYLTCFIAMFFNKAVLSAMWVTFFYAFIFFTIAFLGSVMLVGHLKGNAVKITEKQFPDIYEILKSHSDQLGLKEVPQAYLLQSGGMLNAFATRFARRDFVVLFSDVMEVAYREGKDAVSFIIGHELGHIKRGHVNFVKLLMLLPARFIPFLSNAYSRACEYTCDNFGYALCPEGALKGILVLAAGKKLYKNVNVEEMLANYKSEASFILRFAEVFSTHPALVKRINSIDQLNKENLTLDGHIFVSPKVKVDDLSLQ